MVERTPDGRYIIVRNRLWRAANPNLPDADHTALVRQLMTARRAVRDALGSGDGAALLAARRTVQAAKEGLGERGPVWWTDGAPDLNRHVVQNSPYGSWYAKLKATS